MASQSEKIAYSYYLGPNLSVEVDDQGQIQVAVRSGSTRLDSRVDTDGWVRSDVSNIIAVADALAAARKLSAAVFAGHGEWRERRDAYLELLKHDKVGRGAKDVTAFLDEYRQAEDLAAEGHREHTSMEKYAAEWERWF